MALERVERPFSDADLMYGLRPVLERLGIKPGDEFVIATGDMVRKSRHAGPAGEDRVGPSASGSDTSRRAALANLPRSGTQRWRVLMEIARRGGYGATRDELVEAMTGKGKKMAEGALDARVWELGPRNGGFIAPDGRTRTTPSGSQAEVLVLTDKGRRELADQVEIGGIPQ